MEEIKKEENEKTTDVIEENDNISEKDDTTHQTSHEHNNGMAQITEALNLKFNALEQTLRNSLISLADEIHQKLNNVQLDNAQINQEENSKFTGDKVGPELGAFK